MKPYKPFTGQSLFDISIQHYGSIDYVIDLMKANNLSCTDTMPEVIYIPGVQVKNPRLQSAVKKRNIIPNSNIGLHNIRYNGDLAFVPAGGADTNIIEGDDFVVVGSYTNVMLFAIILEFQLQVSTYAVRSFRVLLAAGATFNFSEVYTNAPLATITATLSRQSIIDDTISTQVQQSVFPSVVAYFYNTAITLVANNGIGYNWGSIETIPPADTTLPVADLRIQQATGTVTVGYIGYAAGFTIRHANGTALCKVLFCEDVGDGKNNITYNVRSGSSAGYGEQPKFFRINNITVSEFWKNSYRLTDPYAAGYSSETNISANLIQYGDCSNFPRNADGYVVDAGLTATIETAQLKLVSTAFRNYKIGSATTTNVFTIGFYRVAFWASTQCNCSIRTSSFIYGGAAYNQGGSFAYSVDVYSLQTTTLNLSYIYPLFGTVFFDNISCFRISHPYGTKVPAHEVLTGKDAMLYNLTNPAS